MQADAELATRLATEAGALLLHLRAQAQLGDVSLGQRADAAANALLVRALRAERPGDALLSEEQAPDPQRLAAQRVWIIDPLDGTREYAEGNLHRQDWAVHVALCSDGVPVAGAVALPAQGRCFSTALRLQALAPRPPSASWRLAVSRSRALPWLEHLADELGAELLPMGSAGAKAMAVLQGQADAYVHDGGLNEWDACAPVAVALQQGWCATALDGEALRFNRPDPLLQGLLIAAPSVHRRLLAGIAAVRGRAAAGGAASTPLPGP
jgi:3'(2'), 5'-bisphosphate nucleotidase